MTAAEQSRTIASIAAHAADQHNGQNIAAIDVSDVMAISDIFLIIGADVDRQVRSIVEDIDDALSKAGFEPLRREGVRENRWVLLDYGAVVIHVQRNQERDYYGLDSLYRDCPIVEIEGIPMPERPGNWTTDGESDPREATSIDDLPLATDEPLDEDIL